MRTLIPILLMTLVITFCGCVSTRSSVKAVGVFKSKEGRHVMLTPDGKFYASKDGVAGDNLRFIGIVSSMSKQPREVFLTTPSAGPIEWMGATLVFSEDFSRFDVFGYEPRTKPTKPPQSSYERVY